MMVYEVSNGYQLADVNAQAVGELLTTMSEIAPLTPERIVEAARDADSPLHGAFEWDDSLAAGRYRLSQARYVVRAIVTVEDDGNRKPFRSFMSVTDLTAEAEDSPRRYVPTAVAASTPAYREQILESLAQQAYAWREKALAFSELAYVVAAIEKLPDPRVKLEKGITEAKKARRRGKVEKELVKQ